MPRNFLPAGTLLRSRVEVTKEFALVTKLRRVIHDIALPMASEPRAQCVRLNRMRMH
jgi:hypothetical protein